MGAPIDRGSSACHVHMQYVMFNLQSIELADVTPAY